MSDDLISRKALKQDIYTDFYEHFTQYHDSDQTALIDMVMDDIDEISTAFDKEKVIDIIARANSAITVDDKNKALYWMKKLEEIVEKGGIE